MARSKRKVLNTPYAAMINHASSFIQLVIASIPIWLVTFTPIGAQQPAPAESGYLEPPQDIVNIVDAAPTPTALISPDRNVLALIERGSAPSINWLARPMHRLAGYRIDPRNSGPWNAPNIVAIEIIPLGNGNNEAPARIKTRVAAPRGTTLGWPRFSPDGTHLSYAVVRDTGIELWVVDLSSRQPRPLTSASLNATWGNPCEWLSDTSGVLCRFRMSARGTPPDPPLIPTGPNVRASNGRSSTVRTYQDLLSSPYDEALFEYHFTSQIATVTLATGSRTAVGKPGMYARVTAAPDTKHFLIERVTTPWSWLVPASRFAHSIEVWTRAGETHILTMSPLADTVPIGGVPTGPRNYQWHATERATLIWIEAQDEGNPKVEAPYRDVIFALPAPFEHQGREIARTEYRFTDIAWTQEGAALITERDRNTRWTRTWIRSPGSGDLRSLFDRSAEDRYGDPGTPLRRLGSGVANSTILQDGDAIYFAGNGASDHGDRPFVDRLNLTTLETERLFQTDSGSYESVVGVLSPDGRMLLTRRESPSEPPNYFIRNTANDNLNRLTEYADPAPILRQVEKRLVKYERDDGVLLSAVLYLPPGYRNSEPLPMLMWAYPREFTNAAAAGQVRGSPYRFTTVRGASHLLLLTAGYAILDGPAMPIVGGGETANDTYVEQLVSSAEAAVEAVVGMGVTDRDRIGIGGHSYGAFMTANLLAHSDLFKAGIARSGAYNRTLTPFGFQNERRTFWEAPNIYGAMSPFFHADQIDEPILLTHGEIDNNTGTFPVQSERFYHALRGHGATVRYVTLPYESHGYVARESVLHVAAEMLQWCETYLSKTTS